jgi:hypothetical protein
MHSYVFGLEIDPLEANGLYVHLPLHCTLVHWFYSSIEPERIILRTTPLFGESPPIELVSKAPALFGRDCTIPVHTIVPNRALRRLHFDILAALKYFGAVYTEPDYVGAGYNPHVTTQGERIFAPGSKARPARAYLAENIARVKQPAIVIRKLFQLG